MSTSMLISSDQSALHSKLLTFFTDKMKAVVQPSTTRILVKFHTYQYNLKYGIFFKYITLTKPFIACEEINFVVNLSKRV